MQFLDWLVVAFSLAVIIAIGVRTRKYTRSVADFMAASRVAGRYLVANATNEAAFGAINVIGQFEVFLVSGFTLSWWLLANNAVWLFVLLSGFIIYRYRESRVMTLGQFFEIRYSKSLRLFAGGLAFLSGILSYGIYPAVGARFFIFFCGLPQAIHVAGLNISTFPLTMGALLAPGVLLTVLGGQLTAMVIDSVAGVITMVFYVVVSVTLLWMFHWHGVSHSMLGRPAGKSLFDPFDTGKIKSFNGWYMAIAILGAAYGWQSSQVGYGFRAAAANAHEQKMGAILGPWRNEARTLFLTVMCMSVYGFLHYSAFAHQAAAVQHTLAGVHNKELHTQLQLPVALALMLPDGVKGMFAAIMLFALISTDCTMLHSWGSIFIQDLVVPLRKKPMTTRQHLFVLRASVVGVALFAFCFSALYTQGQYILMFFAIAGAVFAGAGAAIIGGFYWKRGTNAGAWGAMLAGAVVTVIGFTLEQSWKRDTYPWLAQHMPGMLHHSGVALAAFSRHVPALGWQLTPSRFPFNGQWIFCFAIFAAIAAYLVLSLLTYREPFNLNRMLHRGPYASPEEAAVKAGIPRKFSIKALVGITPEFTRGDKAISLSLFGYRFLWFIAFVIITAWNLWHPWPMHWWVNFWYLTGVLLELVLGVIVTVWFIWGTTVDLRRLFRALDLVLRNPLDDGTVVRHHNLDEPGPSPEPHQAGSAEEH